MRIERVEDERVYVLDHQDVRYRVYDAGVQAGRYVPHQPPSRGAPYRIFVSSDGVRRIYHFDRGEDRALTPEALARQFAAASLRDA